MLGFKLLPELILAILLRGSNHTHQFTNFQSRLSGKANLASWKMGHKNINLN